MVVITIFSAFVSVSYDRKELAVLSLIGGFAVPFMVSTGEGNYKVLFTYIAILNIGMLIIAYFKKWSLVTLLAFIFSCVLFSFWFGEKVIDGGLPYRGALFMQLFSILSSVLLPLLIICGIREHFPNWNISSSLQIHSFISG
jgi:cellulose synthase/poly-beta-1,6-N-acetylglucosamine synthase-like glycosyltransferase